jgi:hypothetical protein
MQVDKKGIERVVAVAEPSCRCRVSNARISRINTATSTPQQENGGKSSRQHIVKQKIQDALPNICRHSLALANAQLQKIIGIRSENCGILKVSAEMGKKREWQATAGNERFGASGGVARPKSSANLQVSCPAQTALSRHLPPSRRDVARNGGQCSKKIKNK